MGEEIVPNESKDEVDAKTAILVARADLEAAGITFVAMHFDGYGDEGAYEDVKCYRCDDFSDVEFEDQVEYDASPLQEHFESLAPDGFQDGYGGFGDVLFDVRTGKIRVIRNDRFEDYNTSEYEV